MNKILLILFGFAVGCGAGATWFAFDQDEPAAVAAVRSAAPSATRRGIGGDA